jgi:hypothetical protein
MKPNELRWSFVSQVTSKKIIADCGYATAGAASGKIFKKNNVYFYSVLNFTR